MQGSIIPLASFLWKQQNGVDIPFVGDMHPGFAPDGIGAISGEFCIKTPENPHHPFSDLLSLVEHETIAFWFDDSVTRLDLTADSNVVIGEFSIGGINSKRIIAGNDVRFNLKFLHDWSNMPSAWRTTSSYPVHARGNNAYRRNCYLAFVIEDYFSVFPKDIYDSLVSPFRQFVVDAVSEATYLPTDISKSISAYLDENINTIDCIHTKQLVDLQIGELLVPKTALFVRSNGDKCYLTFKSSGVPSRLSGGKPFIQLGASLISAFHFSIHFDVRNGDFVQFSQKQSVIASNNNTRTNMGRDCMIC